MQQAAVNGGSILQVLRTDRRTHIKPNKAHKVYVYMVQAAVRGGV